MNKRVTVFFLLMILSKNIFAVDFSMSAGGGGLAGYTFTRYTMEEGGVKSFQTMDRANYAGLLFFDAAYGEFSVLLQGGKNSYRENLQLGSSSLGDDNGTGTSASLGLSLLGKYPFTINEKFSWFPLFGIEYHIALAEKRKPDGYEKEHDRVKGIEASDRDKNDEPYPLHAWNSFWIDVGAGIDYFVYGPLFLRTELLFGFRLPTGYELGALEVVKKQLGVQNPKLAGLTGSPALKIAVGYRLY